LILLEDWLRTILLFNGCDLGETAAMAFLASKTGIQEMGAKILGQFRPDHASAEDKDVHIVMLHALMCGISIMAKTGPNAGKFVGSHGRTHAATANQDTAFAVALHDVECQSLSEIGIVYRVCAVRSQVIHRVPLLTQEVSEQLFQLKTGMIGCNGDLHFLLQFCRSLSLAKVPAQPQLRHRG